MTIFAFLLYNTFIVQVYSLPNENKWGEKGHFKDFFFSYNFEFSKPTLQNAWELHNTIIRPGNSWD